MSRPSGNVSAGRLAKAGDFVRLGRCRCGAPIFAQAGHGESYDMQPGTPLPAERDDLTCFGCRVKARPDARP